MRRVRGLTRTGLATLAAIAGGLAFASVPALALEGLGPLSTFEGGGTPAGSFVPRGIAVDNSAGAYKGDVYVVDTTNHVVDRFSATGVYQAQIVDGLSNPVGVAVDASGNVYVVDTGHNVVKEFDPTTSLTTPVHEFGAGALTGPTGVAVDSSGDVFVADTGDNVVKEFEPSKPTTVKSTFGEGALSAPTGVAVLSNGDVDVVDAAGEVHVFNETGEAQPSLSNPVGASPEAVGVSPTDVLYVVYHNGETVKYDTAGAVLSQSAKGAIRPCEGTEHGWEAGCPRFGGATTAGVWAIAIGSSGDAYISNSWAWKPEYSFGEPYTLNQVVVFQPGTFAEALTGTPASEVTATTATVPGEVNPKGTTLVSCEVEYGLTTSYGQSAPCAQELTSLTGSALLPVTAHLKGLEPNITYHYQLVVRNGIGLVSKGGDQTLFTSPAPPELISESASSVGVFRKELAAIINPENQETKYYFEYSTAATGEELEGEVQTVEGEAPLGAEYGELTASVNISGNFGLTYYYRVVATNGTGTITGKVEAYTQVPIITGERSVTAALTSSSARLDAMIYPNIEATTYMFEYATSIAALEGGKGMHIPGGSGQVGEAEEQIPPTPVSVEVLGLQSGQTYYYRVLAENETSNNPTNIGKGKPVAGPIESFEPYAAPVPTTGEAQSVTGNTAALTGEVDPEGAESTYYFAYIDQAGYEKALAGDAGEKANPYANGETTAPLSVGASRAEAVVVTPVVASGLVPGGTYHYALVATNKFGARGVGADKTFTTSSPTPPIVTTGVATGVSQNSATLSGTVTTNGLQTNYGFEIAAEPGNYGPATGLGSVGGAATEEVKVTLGELQPGTTYYYRLTATNADGTVHGEPATFATPGFPVLLSAPASLVVTAAPNIAFPPEEAASGTSTKKKTLTSKEKLGKALRACDRDKSKSKRVGCERQAHRRYGGASRRKNKK
jgi:NHL repeat-containing protein